MAAQTAAQRQAQRKARQLAAGMRIFQRWAHPDDHGPLSEAADDLERKRAEAATLRAKPKSDHT